MYFESRALKRLVNLLSTWENREIPCVTLLGDVGVGKTWTAREACRKTGYEPVEVDFTEENAVESFLRLKRSRSFWHKIALIADRPSEALGKRDLYRLVRDAVNPVIFEDEPGKRRFYTMCEIIYVDPPPKTLVVRELRESGRKINYSLLGRDVRQAMLMKEGSEGYGVEKWDDPIRNYFLRGNPRRLGREHLPSVLDTGLRILYGNELLKLINGLLLADITGRPSVLPKVNPYVGSWEVQSRFYELLKRKRVEEREEKG